MLVFMGISLIAVFILGYLVFNKHSLMTEYAAEKEKLRGEIKKIAAKRPTPVQKNIDMINNDTGILIEKTRELHRHFGHPYNTALQAFARELGVPLPKFKSDFLRFWEKSIKTGSIREQVYRKYKLSVKGGLELWNKAMQAFAIEAQKCTIEKISANNVDGIFLAALGIDRILGNSSINCKAFMRKMRYSMIDYYDDSKKKKKNKISFGNNASMFSFDEQQLPSKANIPRIVKCWEIISDLGRRIADAKISQLDAFSKRALEPRIDGDFRYYRFSFTVTGSIESIRSLIRILYHAYKDNRVYLIKKMSVKLIKDEAQTIRSASQRGDDKFSRLLGEEKKSSEELENEEAKKSIMEYYKKKRMQQEKGLQFNARADYGKVIIGNITDCIASFEVDYVIYSPLK